MISLKRSVLILGLLLVLPSCERAQPAGERAQPASKSSDEAALQALQKSIEWLDANPPNPATANLGSIGMDAWSWALIARLHPSDAVRQRAKQEARKRLGQLEPVIEPTPVADSYWALRLDSMGAVGIDTSPYLAGLSQIDLSEIVKKMSPTTALWTSGLLRPVGIAVEVDPAATVVATDAAASDWKPTVRSAYAIYHEIAGDTDLGRVAPVQPAPAGLCSSRVAAVARGLHRQTRHRCRSRGTDHGGDSRPARASLLRRRYALADHATTERWHLFRHA
jgi:hypothetical protein